MNGILVSFLRRDSAKLYSQRFLCPFLGDQNGTVVLIGQDGLQLPPLSFPSGSLLPFLTCLEQGLGPQGRFDPPLSNSHIHPGSQNKRNILTEKIAKLGEEQDSNVSQDFVFRLINGVKTSAVGMESASCSFYASTQAISCRLPFIVGISPASCLCFILFLFNCR